MNEVITKIFLECARAIDASELITRGSRTDKEYSFQNWFSDRLSKLGLNFDEPSKNANPDFRLIDFQVGFEIKGLGFPGREANYDCNSQVPSGRHNGREIYYVVGSYGDMMIHDRKMYVAPTPYELTSGTGRQVTFIAPGNFTPSRSLKLAGVFTRIESAKLIRGYSFDMVSHVITPALIANPDAGKNYPFTVFRAAEAKRPEVTLS